MEAIVLPAPPFPGHLTSKPLEASRSVNRTHSLGHAHRNDDRRSMELAEALAAMVNFHAFVLYVFVLYNVRILIEMNSYFR